MRVKVIFLCIYFKYYLYLDIVCMSFRSVVYVITPLLCIMMRV